MLTTDRQELAQGLTNALAALREHAGNGQQTVPRTWAEGLVQTGLHILGLLTAVDAELEAADTEGRALRVELDKANQRAADYTENVEFLLEELAAASLRNAELGD